MTKIHRPRKVFRTLPLPLSSVALGVGLLAASMSAHAFDLDTGNPDVTARWDNTVRYNLGVRAQAQDAAILASNNYDDGDRNFARNSIVANRFDVLSELDVAYKKAQGFRVSGTAWYDAAYASTSGSNASLATTNNIVNGVPGLGYNDYVKRFARGFSGELLDAFVFANLDAGGTPVSVKLGRSVDYWGESLYGNTHGVAYAQMPLDSAKALATPGIEVKELYRPINNLSLRFSPTDTVSLAAQYFLDWEASRGPEPGTYLGPSDSGVNSGSLLYALPRLGAPFNIGPFNFNRIADVTPKKSGEYGLSMRWNSSELDGILGMYYRRFADKSGQVHLANLVPTGTSALPAALQTAAAGAGIPAGIPSNYFFAYADKIDLYGLSLAKVIGGASFAGEVSYRKNMPLVSDQIVVLPGKALPASGETYGARGNTWHALTNVVALLPAPGSVSTLTFQGELAWSRWEQVSTDPLGVFKGSAAYLAKGKIDGVTKDNMTLNLGLTPLWQQAFPGIDISVPLSYSVGLSGNSAVSGGGSKNAGSWSVGITADAFQKYNIALRYAGYFGDLTTSSAGTVAVYNGTQALLKDRGWLSLTLKATF